MEPRKRFGRRSGPGRTADPESAPGLSPLSSGVADSGLLSINLRYFALRAVIFGAVLAVVLLVGVGGALGFALALVFSGLLSYPLALRQRRAVVGIMENRGGGRR
jgi:hypothetical protein